jgi:hypothetical protein
MLADASTKYSMPMLKSFEAEQLASKTAGMDEHPRRGMHRD